MPDASPISSAPRAALYARVSTDQQAEKYGLEAQRQLLQQYAITRQYAVVPDGALAVFADDESGGTLDRPAWRRVEALIDAGGVQLLVALDPDRLSRDLVDMLTVERRLQGRGVGLEFVHAHFDASPQGRAFFQVRGVFAELERSVINERMVRGKREKARQGRVVNPGTLPTWLRSLDGGQTVQLDQTWAPVVRDMFRWYVEDGLTLRGIAARLTAQGIRTPSGGAVWQPSVVRGWLTNRAAKGDFVQFRYEAVAPRKRKITTRGPHPRKSSMRERPEDEWAHVAVPAVVGDAVWAMAQERLQQNQKQARRNGRRTYLLRGLILCGTCGRRMTGVYTGQRHGRVYRCSGRVHGARVDGSGACRMRDVPADWAEHVTWERVARLLQDPAALAAELHRQRTAPLVADAASTQEWQRRLEEIRREMNRLADAYQKGIFPEDLVAEKMNGLRADWDRIKALESHARDRDAQQALDQSRQERVLDFARRIGEGLSTVDAAGQQRVLQLVLQDVVASDEQLTIHAVFPVEAPIQSSTDAQGLCTDDMDHHRGAGSDSPH